MINNFLYCDFEFRDSNEPNMTLVCLSMRQYSNKILGESQTFWLLDGDEYVQARSLIYSYIQEEYVFVSYNVVAEARCILQMGFDPREMRWIDLMLEYKQIMNHNHSTVHGVTGKHLLKSPAGNTMVKTLLPPCSKWERVESSSDSDYSKVNNGLESAVYKFVGIMPEDGYKNKMHDIILSNKTYTEEQKKQILEYCESDIHELNTLHKNMTMCFAKRELLNFGKNRTNYNNYLKASLLRGEYSARTALMEHLGYPVDVEAMASFAGSVKEILSIEQKRLLELYPEIEPFSFIKKTGLYKTNTLKIKAWVANQYSKDDWLLTDKEDYSLSKDAFDRYYTTKSEPLNFGDHYLRYLKTKQSLNGFSPNSSRGSIFDSLGSDGRVRPYMNIYGSQSSRSQPSSKSFIFLKAKWMRALVKPNKGKVLIGCDYASQEYLLAALLSSDEKMIDSYISGDPYLAFAKLAGVVPPDGTKKEYAKERDIFKTATLGISYLMSKYGLGKRLRAKGYEHTDDDAQELIDTFDRVFSKYTEFKDETLSRYNLEGKLVTPDGWVMFGDNPNHRSVCNFPVQAFGASVMRKAVELAQDKYSLVPIFTLHDAIYFEADASMDTLPDTIDLISDCMMEAFVFYFKDSSLEAYAKQMRLDFDVWGATNDLTLKTKGGIEVTIKDIYIPEGYEEDYKRFSKYFDSFDFLG